jgi:uncharacterized protein YjbI with pentapeptide repeats
LRRAELNNTDLHGAVLRQADLRETDLGEVNLRRAKYNDETVWPANFDHTQVGAIHRE